MIVYVVTRALSFLRRTASLLLVYLDTLDLPILRAVSKTNYGMGECILTGIREAITMVGDVLRTGRHAGHRRAALLLASTASGRPRIPGPLATERRVEDGLVIIKERGHVAVRARPE